MRTAPVAQKLTWLAEYLVESRSQTAKKRNQDAKTQSQTAKAMARARVERAGSTSTYTHSITRSRIADAHRAQPSLPPCVVSLRILGAKLANRFTSQKRFLWSVKSQLGPGISE
jgi:hypothetical protein